MSRDALSTGYVGLMRELYAPKAYFARVDDLLRDRRVVIDRAWRDYARAHPLARLGRNTRLLLEAFGLFATLLLRIPDQELRRIYRQRFLSFLAARPDPQLLRIYALKCAIHWHMTMLVRRLSDRAGPIVNSY
jgi:hypothetical protein